ncbi:outer membrane protein [Candidatus Fervidibacteria bacterium JGI MDM2 SSWTFF-3-K9]
MRWATVLGLVFCLLATLTAQVDPLSTRPKIRQALSLKEAVEIALRESPVLRGAVAELKATEARLKMARSEKRWQISVNTFASVGTESGIFASPPIVMPSATMLLPRRTFLDANAMLMLPIFTGGRLEALIRQAEAVRYATAAQLEAMRLDVALETKLAYRRALLAREMIRVAEAYVAAMEERVRVDKVAAKVGRIPEFWVLRSEAELANAQQMLANAQRDYEIALITLKAIMGVHPDSEITLTDELGRDAGRGARDGLKVELLEREKLMAEAMAKRPELKAALRQAEAQSHAVRAAKALYAPQVSLMAMADYMKGTGDMGQGTGGYLAGIVIGLPVLDGGRRKAMVGEAQAMQEKALAEVERLKLQIASEVDTALRELQTALKNLQTAQMALRSAEEDERVAKVRYEAGRSVLVEYLDALAALVRAQVNYAQAIYELSVAHDKLLRAVGKGLPED